MPCEALDISTPPLRAKPAKAPRVQPSAAGPSVAASALFRSANALIERCGVKRLPADERQAALAKTYPCVLKIAKRHLERAPYPALYGNLETRLLKLWRQLLKPTLEEHILHLSDRTRPLLELVFDEWLLRDALGRNLPNDELRSFVASVLGADASSPTELLSASFTRATSTTWPARELADLIGQLAAGASSDSRGVRMKRLSLMVHEVATALETRYNDPRMDMVFCCFLAAAHAIDPRSQEIEQAVRGELQRYPSAKVGEIDVIARIDAGLRTWRTADPQCLLTREDPSAPLTTQELAVLEEAYSIAGMVTPGDGTSDDPRSMRAHVERILVTGHAGRSPQDLWRHLAVMVGGAAIHDKHWLEAAQMLKELPPADRIGSELERVASLLTQVRDGASEARDTKAASATAVASSTTPSEPPPASDRATAHVFAMPQPRQPRSLDGKRSPGPGAEKRKLAGESDKPWHTDIETALPAKLAVALGPASRPHTAKRGACVQESSLTRSQMMDFIWKITGDKSQSTAQKQHAIRTALNVPVVNQHATLTTAFEKCDAAEWPAAELIRFLIVISAPSPGLRSLHAKSLARLAATADKHLRHAITPIQWFTLESCFGAAIGAVSTPAAEQASTGSGD